MGSAAAALTMVAFFAMSATTTASEQQQGMMINVTCMLVFGDSTVDTGNNNALDTSVKANFPPYGRDFFGHLATGRFSDGRLSIDFIAESLGIVRTVPAFHDPNLTPEQLGRGVSFASASSGYDELTASLSNVLSMGKQVENFEEYIDKLHGAVGDDAAAETTRGAVYVISAGTNDFVLNYFMGQNRSSQFTLGQYEGFLVEFMSLRIREIHRIAGGGAGVRFFIVGLPPMGCLPVVRMLAGGVGCVAAYNDAAVSFNSRVRAELSALEGSLGVKTAFLDVYDIMLDVVNDPAKYGLEETTKGCCGTGTVEVGESCRGLDTCADPGKYMFFDAVHPTQRTYEIIAAAASAALRDTFA